ncbi:MAG: hypothetical protein ACREOU_05740 [Candidatus Eiseniibacteriota bacterium]
MRLLQSLSRVVLPAVATAVVAFALAAPAHAQGRITTPGVYPASVVYIPGISVPGGLPDCVDPFVRQIYLGEVTIVQTGSGYDVSFEGTNEEDPKLKVRASGSFNASWGGLLLGELGGRSDAIVGIDYVNMVSGKVQGKVIGNDGKKGNLRATLGLGGEFLGCSFHGPGSH